MSNTLSEFSIICTVAKLAAKRVARKVIRDLQRMTETLSGDNSGLKTTWDEICVQVQGEQSFHWNVYDLTVQNLVEHHVSELPGHEKEALWLQTPQGDAWDSEDDEQRESNPVSESDIVEHVIQTYVYSEAMEWSNHGIRSYMERACFTD